MLAALIAMAFNSSNFDQADYGDVPFTPSPAFKLRESMAARAAKAEFEPKTSSPNYLVRSIVTGLIGALIAAGMYAAFANVTGITRGYFAIAVGYIVGKAMKLGAGDEGGTQYQVTAVALTYLSVAAAHSMLIWWIAHLSRTFPINFASVAGLATAGLLFPLYKFIQSPVTGIVATISLFVGLRGAWRSMAPGA